MMRRKQSSLVPLLLLSPFVTFAFQSPVAAAGILNEHAIFFPLVTVTLVAVMNAAPRIS